MQHLTAMSCCHSVFMPGACFTFLPHWGIFHRCPCSHHPQTLHPLSTQAFTAGLTSSLLACRVPRAQASPPAPGPPWQPPLQSP